MSNVDSIFFDNDNNKRLALGIGAAIFTHMLVLAWFALPANQQQMAAEIFSAPTNISIRFVTPAKEKPVVIKKTAPAPIKVAKVEQPPEILNTIEPAAAQQQATQPIEQTVQDVITPQPVQKTIPVVSDKNLKGRRVQPQYPARALRMGQEGVVWLHVLINESGSRQDIKIHKPSQYALLNQAAIKAVKKWTFSPNLINGRAAASWVEIPIEFKIQ